MTGRFLVAASVADPHSHPEGLATNAFSGNAAIPDNNSSGILSPLAISGVTRDAVISKITVTLSINHPVDEDVDIFLFDPDGNSIVLSTDNGTGSADYTNTVFDDAAAALISAGSPPSPARLARSNPSPVCTLAPSTETGR